MRLSLGTYRPGLGRILLAWWQGWKRKRHANAELDCCGSEAKLIAQDVGVPETELRVLAAKRPDSADLLYQRLAALHLDAETIASTQGGVMRDLQRLCTACTTKGKCAGDLAAHPASPEWQTYCPNAPTLSALTGDAENAKAVARLERRAARRGEKR